MSAATAGPTLAMAAALHVFLAQNPELSALPVSWTIDEREGITASVRRHPGADADVQAVAVALGLEATRYVSVGKDGRRDRMTSAAGLLGSHKVFVHGWTLLPAEDGAE